MLKLPFMALIFSYSCPGGGRKNGDTIARPSMFQKAQVSWEEKKFLADYGLRDQRIFAAIYVTEGRISIRVICVKEWFYMHFLYLVDWDLKKLWLKNEKLEPKFHIHLLVCRTTAIADLKTKLSSLSNLHGNFEKSFLKLSINYFITTYICIRVLKSAFWLSVVKTKVIIKANQKKAK